MNQISTFVQLWRNMGARYMIYRVRHEFEKRTGILESRFPYTNVEVKYFSSKSVLDSIPFYKNAYPKIKKSPHLELKETTARILKGDVQMFSSKWESLGLEYDWVTNPDSGYRYPLIHWSKINDYDSQIGDIKFVWEKSRFSWLHTIIRNDFHFEEDHSEFVFNQIDSWIQANPINLGPNYRCSQEMSLRLWNWSFAFRFYRDSEHFTEERWKIYQNVIYWHLHHIYNHINFSRIAVRNNHAITETGMLYLSQWLFPFIPETKKWSQHGGKWFNQEIEYQLYPDGTFLQFSMNYHRVVVQLLSGIISTAHMNGAKLSNVVYDRAWNSVNFLYQCVGNFEKGELPNYGQNDGAWFFPLTNTEYRDYRPMLNSLHKILTSENLFNEEEVQEEWAWFGSIIAADRPVVELNKGISEFPVGGFYLIREKESLTFYRNGNHKDRPAQADNQHIDIWYKGSNVLMDSGTYKYNTEPELIKYFMGSKGHNVLQIGDYDQMLKGSRFIWYHWTQSIGVSCSESDEHYVLEGKISAFRHLNNNGVVTRRIVKQKGNGVWLISDSVNSSLPQSVSQLWHIGNLNNVRFSRAEHDQDELIENTMGYSSSYYGIKNEVPMVIMHSSQGQITTKIEMK